MMTTPKVEADRTPVELFVEQGCKLDPLSRQEEADLGRKILDGTPAEKKAAVDKLVLHNTRFAVNQAKTFNGHGRELEDLLQDGLLGMRHAATRFDYRKGYRFITYARFWIRQYMQQGTALNAKVVNLPVQTMGVLATATDAEAVMHQKRQTISPEAVAKAAGLRLNIVKATQVMRSSFISLDAPLAEGDPDGTTHLEMLRDEHADTGGGVDTNSTVHLLETILGRLTERDRKVLTMHFGLGDTESFNLREIGDALGVSRERARQLKNMGFQRMVLAATEAELIDLGSHLGMAPEDVPPFRAKVIQEYQDKYKQKGADYRRTKATKGVAP